MTAGILVLGYHHRETRKSKQHIGVLAPLTADRLRGRERPVFVSTPDPYLSYQDVGRLGRWGGFVGTPHADLNIIITCELQKC